MTNPAELRHLSRWCAARELTWQPSRTDTGRPAIRLHSRLNRRAWREMLLVEEADGEGVALIDGDGARLADASEIPALLDALDIGLAARPLPPSLPPEEANRQSGQLSSLFQAVPLIWNWPGCAIT